MSRHSSGQALLAALYPAGIGATSAAASFNWAAVLEADGAEQAARGLLAVLDGFEATQLAAAGLAAVPLVSTCLLAAGGRYSGLVVRPQRKQHGARRRVDGPVDPKAKVAIVLHVLDSGKSFLDAAGALEDEGLVVEGLAALVEMPYRGGARRVRGLGYRVETAFDLPSDVEAIPPPTEPRRLQAQTTVERVPDGLHPAQAARLVAAHLVATGEVLQPPHVLDREEDGRGGVWVSFRRRRDDHRIARRGFWHFDPGNAVAARDVVAATAMTVRACLPPLTVADLADLKIAVTFFSALQPVEPTALDFDRYGIVVRSRPFPMKMGGALPDTQFFTTTFEQYRHARETNAGIGPFEPHDVFRHRVTKRVEPGADWPSFGVGGAAGPPLAPDLGERLVAHAQTATPGGDLGPQAPGAPGPLVAVTLYDAGRALTAVSSNPDLEKGAADAARAARAQRDLAARWPTHREQPDGIAVAVLRDPQRLGVVTAARAARTIRAGRDTYSVSHGPHARVFLDADWCHQSWSKENAAAQLTRAAGITTGQASWTVYRTTSWTQRANRVYPLEFGARRRNPGNTLGPLDIALMAEHLHRRLDVNGWPASRVDAVPGSFERGGPGSWSLEALIALTAAAEHQNRPDWRHDADRGLAHAVRHVVGPDRPTLMIPGVVPSPTADAHLLRALALSVEPEPRPAAEPFAGALADAMHGLARRIAGWVRPDGSVLPEGVTPARSDPDGLPGAALLALASYQRATGRDLPVPWSRVLSWYRNRFSLLHPWDLAAWHCQVWPVVGEVTGESHYSELALECADWMCRNQLEADGSFLSDTSDSRPAGPTSQVALVAAGISAAWRWADVTGDAARSERYAQAWTNAMGFLDRLLVRPDDTYWMPAAGVAVGAIRTTQTCFELRGDATSHALTALIAGAHSPVTDQLEPDQGQVLGFVDDGGPIGGFGPARA